MKKTILLLSISLSIFGQIDTFKTPIYLSVFDKTIKQPLYVQYDLFRGGGDCSRKGLTFKEYTETLKNKDYVGSGFDKGHLANSEDFADICTNDKLTFDLHNAIPQYPNLNRGIWKHHEDSLRIISQHMKLQIICGAIYLGAKQNRLSVPTYCFKIAYEKESKNIIICYWYSNEKTNNWFKKTSIIELNKYTNYSLKVK